MISFRRTQAVLSLFLAAPSLAAGCKSNDDANPSEAGAGVDAGGAFDGGDSGNSLGIEAGSADAGDADGGTSGWRTLAEVQDAWCPILTQRFCTAAEACGCTAIPGFSESEGRCSDRAERGCRAQLERFAEGVAAGELTVAKKLPASCVPTLEAALADCRMPETDLFVVSCPLVWPRQLATLPSAGSACVEGLCAEATRCNSKDVCEVPKSLARCVSNGDCPADERCSSEGVCGKPDFEDNGTACKTPAACTGDVMCFASAKRTCQPKQPGGACTSDAECTDDEFCGTEGCEPSPSDGQACGGGVACAAGFACRIAPGDGQDTCQPLPKSGEPCALGRLGPFICSEGLACRDRYCGPIPGTGETCGGGGVRCADDLGCHVENDQSVCRPRVGEGAPCGLDDSCNTGLYCNFQSGLCAPWKELGALCSDDPECGAGTCVPDDLSVFRCVPQPTEGEACFLDTCASGLACASPYEAGTCAPAMCATFQF